MNNELNQRIADLLLDVVGLQEEPELAERARELYNEWLQSTAEQASNVVIKEPQAATEGAEA